MDTNDTFEYTGSELLLTNERALANYNAWIVKHFAKVLAGAKPKRVLDFGAGIGSLAAIFRDQTAVQPEALEVDARQREILQKRGFSTYGSIDELSGVYDLIYTSNVLEHIEDDVSALRSLRERLSVDGRIAVFVPAFKMIWTSMDDKVGHFRRYTKQMLRNNLEQAGYEVEQLSYRDSIGFMVALAFKATGNKSGEPSYRSLWIFDRFLLPISKFSDLFMRHAFGKNVLAIARPRK